MGHSAGVSLLLSATNVSVLAAVSPVATALRPSSTVATPVRFRPVPPSTASTTVSNTSASAVGTAIQALRMSWRTPSG